MTIQLGWIFVGLCILWVTPWVLAFWALAVAYDAREKAGVKKEWVVSMMDKRYEVTLDYVDQMLDGCIKWPLRRVR
jgi:hypothetical protein